MKISMYIHQCPSYGNKYKTAYPHITSMYCNFCGYVWNSKSINYHEVIGTYDDYCSECKNEIIACVCMEKDEK